MVSIESVVAELKSLPAVRLEEAAFYIHQLQQQAQTERIAAIRGTSGILSAQEADEWMKAIESCEQVDEPTWWRLMRYQHSCRTLPRQPKDY